MGGRFPCVSLRRVNSNQQSRDTLHMQTMTIDEQRQAAIAEWVNDFKGRQVRNGQLQHTCNALVLAAVRHCGLNPCEDLLPALMVVVALADGESSWCSVERLAQILRRPPGAIVVALERGVNQGLLRVRVCPNDAGRIWVTIGTNPSIGERSGSSDR